MLSEESDGSEKAVKSSAQSGPTEFFPFLHAPSLHRKYKGGCLVTKGSLDIGMSEDDNPSTTADGEAVGAVHTYMPW